METPQEESAVYRAESEEKRQKYLSLVLEVTADTRHYDGFIGRPRQSLPELADEQINSAIERAIDARTLRSRITNETRELLKHFNPDNDHEKILSQIIGFLPTEWLIDAGEKSAAVALQAVRELGRRRDFGGLTRIFRAWMYDASSRREAERHYEFMVLAVESAFSRADGAQLLYLLSERIAKEEKTGNRIEDHREQMSNMINDNPLSLYQAALEISDEDLRTLNGERLLVVAGGKSMIKHQLSEQRIECDITNVDPGVDEDEPDIAHRIIKQNFFDVELPPHSYKEVWSALGLPQYAFTPKEAAVTFTKSLHLVKENGMVRLGNISISRDSVKPSMDLSRPLVHMATDKVVNLLIGRPDLFRVITFTTVRRPDPNIPWREKATDLPGVKIELVGDPAAADEFLQSILPQFEHFVVSPAIEAEFGERKNQH